MLHLLSLGGNAASLSASCNSVMQKGTQLLQTLPARQAFPVGCVGGGQLPGQLLPTNLTPLAKFKLSFQRVRAS
eukprot:10297_4